MIADMGSVRPGVPTLTVGLRGMAGGDVGRDARRPEAQRQFGGAAPDALRLVLRALATLHDENGDVAVEGLCARRGREPPTAEDEFRTLAEVKDGLPLVGTGGLG